MRGLHQWLVDPPRGGSDGESVSVSVSVSLVAKSRHGYHRDEGGIYALSDLILKAGI